MPASQVVGVLGGIGVITAFVCWWVVTKAVKAAVRIGLVLAVCGALAVGVLNTHHSAPKPSPHTKSVEEAHQR